MAEATLDYRIRFTEPWAHLADIELTVPAAGGRALDLWMPVWTPGSYLVREYARHVESFSASDSSGRELPWRKTSKNHWEVEPGGADRVVVRYRVYGHEMSVRTNWVEDAFAFLNGASTFLTVRGMEHSPHRLTLEIPPAWAGVWTSLERTEAGGVHGADAAASPGAATHSFLARDLDELIDSPILAGTPAVYDFTVDNKPIRLVNLGEGGLWDGEKTAADVKRIVEAYRDLYGTLPFSHYIFFNLIVEGSGGLEHKNSCVLMASRYAYRKRSAYIDWLGLASHEFFHVWNVKRSRPVALGPFDYENENYTHSLWVAEGITNYYTDLMPRRAGLTTDKEFLGEFSKLIDTLQNTPGRALHSLEESSFDAWIKLYRQDENTANTTISYYVKGGVVAWLLDAEIRRATGGRRSLDDLMRLLFMRHAGERGYTEEEVERAAAEVAGGSLSAFFDACVRGTGELDYSPVLGWLGLRFKPVEAGGEDTPRVWLGLETRADNGRLLVKSVRRDGPAREAGINADDEILAVGGYRVTAANLNERMQQYEPGERVEVMLARRDAVRMAPITLAPHPGTPWKLEADPAASGEAAARREAWLGRG
jgi:predicted metalloprotease with PDZ domain